MVLNVDNIPLSNVFKHSKEYGYGLVGSDKRRDLIVALDGSGDFDNIADALKNLSSGGGRILIKEGTYIIKSGLVIPVSNVRLTGSGFSTKITIPTLGVATTLISATSKNKIIIENLRIAGLGVEDDNGISLDTCNNCLIQDCFVENCNDNGIVFDTVTESYIIKNKLAGSVTNISVVDSDRNIINENIISGGTSGISLSDSLNNKIVNNNVINGSDDGIRIANGSDNNIIGGNRVDGFSGAGDFGIVITGGGDPGDRNIINDNIVLNCDTNISDGGTNSVVADNISA